MDKFLFILLTFLLIPTILYNTYSFNSKATINYIYKYDNESIIKKLKTKELYLKGDFKEVYSLTYSYVNRTLEDSLVSLMDTDRRLLIDVIIIVAIAEGSTVSKKGSLPFKSVLFINHNNPFGIKGNGEYYNTIEYVKNNRIYIKSEFKHYNSFEEAINDFVYLLYRRYGKSFNSANEIFYAMKIKGYFTSPDYEKKLLNLYNKINESTRYD